ncbi:FMN-binding protein [Clostridium estertheticum]|uniref:FMN-binding protein n=1 Tax=Clostridium estertheticum TaxID=238834 RepID=UPI001C6E7E9F|nr:FMN-binding protein [Clostridium estertheticum]MBW9172315.1 FMN-binding protein [Clostridium estertheticum]WLC76908.1 FMN-binding protein [Clostridium estertheticum]
MSMFIKIILGVIFLLVLIIAGAGFYMTRGLNSGKNMIIKPSDASQLKDGDYTGKYNGGRWSNEVNVTIKDKKVTKIDVLKSVVFEKLEVSRELFNKVIKKQDTNVDVISGATVTSKAYLKSIENALENRN